jgi:hypothetical protein
MKQIIFYSQEEAKKAANEMIAANPSYTIVSGEIDDKADAEESDSFRELVGSWSGEVAAFQVEDERFQIAAKFGYWE